LRIGWTPLPTKEENPDLHVRTTPFMKWFLPIWKEFVDYPFVAKKKENDEK